MSRLNAVRMSRYQRGIKYYRDFPERVDALGAERPSALGLTIVRRRRGGGRPALDGSGATSEEARLRPVLLREA
ncbi:hypothetical protein GCM10022416_27670 [Actinomadura keratinilytica]|uniref:Uncharacterized protein n=1 Tax=Actinomadura keratinilytica TaxID=547461 RepID=A0ABP7YSA6_9ACTN